MKFLLIATFLVNLSATYASNAKIEIIYDLLKDSPEVIIEKANASEIDVNVQDGTGFHVLHYIISREARNAFDEILKIKNLDLNVRDSVGRTPLYYAVQNNHLDYIQTLIDDPRVNLNLANRSGWTPLMKAVEDENHTIIRMLLGKESLDVNYKNKNGWNALMVAADSGYEKIVELLLSRSDLDVNAENNYSWSAIALAADEEHYGVVDILLNDPRVNLYQKNLLLGDYEFLFYDREYTSQRVDILDFIGTEVEKIKYNNGINSLYIDAKSVLVVDDMILDLNYENLVTQGKSLFGQESAREKRFYPLKPKGTHGDLVSAAIMSTDINGMNFIEVVSNPSVHCRNYDELNIDKLIQQYNPDVINVSCGYSKVKSVMRDMRELNEIAARKKVFLLTSAGNKNLFLPKLENRSDYFFQIASVDDVGMLTFKEHDNGSNHGLSVDFAAKAENLYLNKVITEDYTDTVFDDWGGTSYATPIVSGLVTRMLNYLPKEITKSRPDLIKKIIKETGDYSIHLINQIENPIVVNPEKTLEYLKGNLFFTYHKTQGGSFLFTCDKRLMKININGKDFNCRKGNARILLDEPAYTIEAYPLPGYSANLKSDCEIKFNSENEKLEVVTCEM